MLFFIRTYPFSSALQRREDPFCLYIRSQKGRWQLRRKIHKESSHFPASEADENKALINRARNKKEYPAGMIKCSFVLNGYMECQGEDITELNFLVRAVKPE